MLQLQRRQIAAVCEGNYTQRLLRATMLDGLEVQQAVPATTPPPTLHETYRAPSRAHYT